MFMEDNNYYYIFNSRIYRDKRISEELVVLEGYEIGKGWVEQDNYTLRCLVDALHAYGNYSGAEASHISKEDAQKITQKQEELQTYQIPGLIFGVGLPKLE